MFLANLSAGSSPYHPSMFEMYATGVLISSLKPALKYLFKRIGERYSWASGLIRYNEEVYYSLLYVLQKHHLQEYDASFEENYYGLKRVRQQSRLVKASSQLTHPDRKAALFFMTVAPYLASKLQKYYEHLTEPLDEDGFENLETYNELTEHQYPLLKRTIRRLVKTLYPYMYTFWKALCFFYQVRYLFSFSPYFSPVLHMLRQRVKRISMEDIMAQEAGTSSVRDELERLWQDPSQGWLAAARSVLRGVEFVVSETFQYGLQIGIFIFKILEWWFSSENQRQRSQNLPTPPPPEKAKPAANGLALPADRTICPICQRKRTNPTCTPAGFVYCYPCIFEYVSTHRVCPVSLAPCSRERLRKLFES